MQMLLKKFLQALIVVVLLLIAVVPSIIYYLANFVKAETFARFVYLTIIQRVHAEKINRRIGLRIKEQKAVNPLDPSKQTVILTISCGQAIRNFLLSPVFKHLSESYNLVIVTSYESDAIFRAQWRQPGVHVVPWIENISGLLERLVAYHLMEVSKSKTHRSSLDNLRDHPNSASSKRLAHKRLASFGAGLGQWLGTDFMIGLWESYVAFCAPKKLAMSVIDAYDPAIVISTAAHHCSLWPLTRYGSEKPDTVSVAYVLSWDNLTTKPIMDRFAQIYALWSEDMVRELKTFFPNINATPEVVGAPMFDIYVQKQGLMTRKQFCSKYKLDPELPIILYTTNTPQAMPDEPEIINVMWEGYAERFGSDKVNLIVRLHPKDEKSRYTKLEKLTNVLIMRPSKHFVSRADYWVPDDRDMKLLLNTMKHADVVINVASTMSLEAFAVGKPVINIGYHTNKFDRRVGIMWKFENYHTSEHYGLLLEKKSVAIAYNEVELLDHINSALAHPKIRKDEMAEVMGIKVSHAGQSSEQLSHIIDRYVHKVQPLPRPVVQEKLPAAANRSDFEKSLKRCLRVGMALQPIASMFLFRSRRARLHFWHMISLFRPKSLEMHTLLSKIDVMPYNVHTEATLPPKKRPRIGMLISDGQSVRTAIHSGLYEKMNEYADVYILTPYVEQLAEIGLDRERLIEVPFFTRTKSEALIRLAGYIVSPSESHRLFVRHLEQTRNEVDAGKRELSKSMVNYLTAVNYGSIKDFLWLYQFSAIRFGALFPLKDAIRRLKTWDFDLLVNVNSINWSSRLWMRAAMIANIPQLSNIISWDNVSTKTLPDEAADIYAVWSKEMDDDFNQTLPYLKDCKRVVIGAPQFGPLRKGNQKISREEFFAAHGLDPAHKLILYTTGSKFTFPKEPECIAALLNWAKNERRDQVQVMVRLHPNDNLERYSEVFQNFPDTPFTLPSQRTSAKGEWIPNEEDMALLSNQLSHADVCINVASTMTLEAFATGKPVINISFDLGDPGFEYYPIKSYYKSRHYKDIIDRGAARLAKSQQQLYDHIDECLANGDDKLELQNEVFHLKCNYPDDAVDRFVDLTKELLRERA